MFNYMFRPSRGYHQAKHVPTLMLDQMITYDLRFKYIVASTPTLLSNDPVNNVRC
jgi:hypothetical protein